MTQAATRPVPLSVQIAEVERELDLRRKVYKKWVQTKRMSPSAAEKHMRQLEAVRATLVALQEQEHLF